MKKTRKDDDRIIHRIVPDRYVDPKRAKRYKYYNEYVVYGDHCRLLVRRVDTRKVLATVLFDKEKLDDIAPIHWRANPRGRQLTSLYRGRSLPFGRALGLEYNGKAYARVSWKVYDFRSNRVVPRTDRRFEVVDADTMKLHIRRPSDGVALQVLFDSEDYDAIKDTVWWVEDHKGRREEFVTIKGAPEGRPVMLDAWLLGCTARRSYIRKYGSHRRELDYRKKALEKRIIRNTYRTVSADTVCLTISHPDFKEAVCVRIDKQARKKVSAHRWFIRRRREDENGARIFSIVDEERKTLPEVVLGTVYKDVVRIDAKGVYECRRKHLLARRHVNIYTPLDNDTVRLDILHPDGTTSVLLDKQVCKRLKKRRWHVIPAGPKGYCEICNSKGDSLQAALFRGGFFRLDRKRWEMSKPIDLRKAAPSEHVRGSVYRRLDAHSGEMEITDGNQIVRIRLAHEDVVQKKLRPRKWSCEMPADGRPLRIFCDEHPCLMRLILLKRNLVVLDPELDESGRIDCRKQSLERWCPENHYRFPDDKRMELLAPVPSDNTVMRIVLDRDDYDQLRKHVWRCSFVEYRQTWFVRNKAETDIKRFLFFNRFARFGKLDTDSDIRVLDFRKERLLRHAILLSKRCDDNAGLMLSPSKRVKSLQAYAQRRQREVDHRDIEKIHISERYLQVLKSANYTCFNEIVVGPASAELQIRRAHNQKLLWRIQLDKKDWRRIAEVHWVYRRKRGGVFGFIKKKETGLKRFLGNGYHEKTIVCAGDDACRQLPVAPNNRYEPVDTETMKLSIRRSSDDAVFEVLFDREDYDKMKRHAWYPVSVSTRTGKCIDVRARHNGKSIGLGRYLLNNGNRRRSRMAGIDSRRLDYRKQALKGSFNRTTYRTLPDGSVEMTLHRPGGKTCKVLIDARDYPTVSEHHWAPVIFRRKNNRQVVCFVTTDNATLLNLVRRGAGKISPPDGKDGVFDYRRRHLLKNGPLNRYTQVDDTTMRLEIEDSEGTVQVLLDKEDCERLSKIRWLFTVEDKRTGRGCLRSKRGAYLQRAVFRNRVAIFSKMLWRRNETIDFRKKNLMTYAVSTYFVPVGDTMLEMRVADGNTGLRLLVDREEKTRLQKCRWRCERSPENEQLRVTNQNGSSLPYFLLGIKTPNPDPIVMTDLKRDRQGRIDCRKQSLRKQVVPKK